MKPSLGFKKLLSGFNKGVQCQFSDWNAEKDVLVVGLTVYVLVGISLSLHKVLEGEYESCKFDLLTFVACSAMLHLMLKKAFVMLGVWVVIVGNEKGKCYQKERVTVMCGRLKALRAVLYVLSLFTENVYSHFFLPLIINASILYLKSLWMSFLSSAHTEWLLGIFSLLKKVSTLEPYWNVC